MSRTNARCLLYTAAVLAACLIARATFAADAVPVVNVNTATEAELQYLPGIGPELASRINDHKEACCDHAEGARAAFGTIDDLLNIKGIGPKKLEAMRPFIVLTGPTTAKGKIRVPKTPKP